MQMSAFAANLSTYDNGLYELGLQVTCHDEVFVSDAVKGTIDRRTPSVRTTFPSHGGAVDSPQDIRAVFDEVINCQSTFASVYIGDQTRADVAITCEGTFVYIRPSPQQVVNSA